MITARQVSVFEVFLDRIFPHSNRIGKDAPFSPHSVRVPENTDLKNSEYGHFSRSG